MDIVGYFDVEAWKQNVRDNSQSKLYTTQSLVMVNDNKTRGKICVQENDNQIILIFIIEVN